VSDFLQDRAKKDGNISSNRDRKDLRALFHWGARKELTTANPTQGLEPYPERREIKYVPPVQDVASVRLVARGERT
jgi:site-specific recombinase XerD